MGTLLNPSFMKIAGINRSKPTGFATTSKGDFGSQSCPSSTVVSEVSVQLQAKYEINTVFEVEVASKGCDRDQSA